MARPLRFPANCLIVSLAASLLPGNRFAWKRNKAGRVHFFWRDSCGRSWEFYKAGSSRKGYLQNALYLGEVKRFIDGG